MSEKFLLFGFPCVTDLSLVYVSSELHPAQQDTAGFLLLLFSRTSSVFPLYSFVAKYCHGRGLPFSFRSPTPLAIEKVKVN